MYYKIFCGIQVKGTEKYSEYKTSKFNRRFAKYKNKLTRTIRESMIASIEMLCNESDMDILKSKLRFHQLHNYTITVDGVTYKNPYDIHLPGGGSNNNNDLVILFDYDHGNKQVILLDIGQHKKLKLSSSIHIDNELIWL